jgi:hypothetical protein
MGQKKVFTGKAELLECVVTTGLKQLSDNTVRLAEIALYDG